MKPVVKLVRFMKKLYQNGLPNLQVSVLNGTWLQQQKNSGPLRFCYRQAALYYHDNHDKHFLNLQCDDN
jgi:hypothetical protein